jgi:outer membrane immunogenic protein
LIALAIGAATMTTSAALASCGGPFAGFYVGGNVGAASNTTITNFNSGLTSIPTPIPFNLQQLSTSSSDGSFTGGGQVGYNWQCGAAVVGLEADFNSVRFSNGANGTFAFPPLYDTQISQSIDWFGTVRGRLGLAYQNVMVFFTAGLAYADVKTSALFPAPICCSSPPASASFSNQDLRFGWTVGGGVEFALAGNWTIKAEGLYVNLGEYAHTYAFVPNPLALPAEKDTATTLTRTDDAFVVARMGLNYKF